eukprot:91925_1
MRMSKGSFCRNLYRAKYVIPADDHKASFLFISSLLEFLVFLYLLLCICRKQWYIKIKHDISKAKAILSPFYDKIIYWYCIVTIIDALMYGIQFASENNLAHLGIIVTSIFAAIANIGEISLEIFIPLLLMQTAIGKKSFKWAYSMTIGICIIECIFIIGKYVHNVAINIWELCAHSLLLLLYIFIYVYVVYQRQYKKRNRARDRILKIYILCVSIIHIILIISYGLSSFNIDGFCLTVIGQYMYCIIFPFCNFSILVLY